MHVLLAKAVMQEFRIERCNPDLQLNFPAENILHRHVLRTLKKVPFLGAISMR
jgi:hypothetical protein